MQIEFWKRYENTKVISWSRISKKEKDERTNNNLQDIIETKLKNEENEPQ